MKPRILSKAVLWENTQEGNNHHLVAFEQGPGTWKLMLYVRKPGGEEQDLPCDTVITAPLPDLVDAFRNMGPTWHQYSVTAEARFKAERRAPIPCSNTVVVWNVDHDSSGGNGVILNDKLEVKQITVE